MEKNEVVQQLETKGVPKDIAEAGLQTAWSLVTEKVLAAIPSMDISLAGARVNEVFLVGEKYICQVEFKQGHEIFDFILRDSVFNLRHSTELKQLPPPSPEVKGQTVKVTEIVLMHLHQAQTIFNYVGDDGLELWKKSIFELFPPTCLTR